MKSRTPRRRHPVVAAALLLGALLATGGLYAAVSSAGTADAAATVGSATAVESGKQLFLEGCSSCHGLAAQGTSSGPSLIGVGAAAVHFQMSTGRMPLATSGVQAPVKPRQYTEEEISQIAAYIASLAPGPARPTFDDLDFAKADLALGGELFRLNCSQCHQAMGQGGPLPNGAYAPSLMNATPEQIYEAMLTGPENMPVFGDGTLTPDDKRDIIAYIEALKTAPDVGGMGLGRLGPVNEGLFIWVAGLAALIAAAVWIGVKSR
ncbi:MAG: c-type cytochrome [Actinomycetota bacterium]|nr:MAG: c-type cytochrome [Actinomycetota bacterium]